jgi:hypothetical protein
LSAAEKRFPDPSTSGFVTTSRDGSHSRNRTSSCIVDSGESGADRLNQSGFLMLPADAERKTKYFFRLNSPSVLQ